MRKTIAQRLTASARDIPHFYLTADCDIGKLVAAREEINASAPKDKDGKPVYKLSVNDFVIKAWALALQRVPEANVTWTEGAMLRHKVSDISVAVSIPSGLITPVIRNAHVKSVSAISAEMKDLAARARARKLKPEEYQGGTSSVSNLGMYGIKDFTAVINPPQSTILAVGAGEERAGAGRQDRDRHHHERDAVLAITAQLVGGARRRAGRRLPPADREPRDDGGVTMAETFDIVVIGAGPGGYVTAIRAASSASRPPSSRRPISAAAATTGAASRPRRCCARRSLPLYAARQGLRPVR